MSYIGRQPQIGNFQICDAISTVNNQAAYTMQVGSVNVIPETAQNMIVSLNGIIQKPNSSYTVAGAVITFSSALVTGDVINFIQILGSVLDLGVPSDDTVTAAKLSSNAVTTVKILDSNITTGKVANDAITLAKMATGTDGNLITYDTNGNPAAVSTGSSGQILTSAGAGAVPSFQTASSGGITQVDLFRLTSDINSNTDPISSNLERADDASSGRIGTGMSVSSGTFTFPETGIYECTFFVNGTCNSQNYNIIIKVTQNNSSYDAVASTSTAMQENRDVNGVATCIVDVTNVSNDKVRFSCSSMSGGSDTVIRGDTALNHTYFRFVRLGDT